MKYDLDYFIEKFEKIPENKWIVGQFNTEEGECHALGHCGVRSGGNGSSLETEESLVLIKLAPNITEVNDCGGIFTNPKERVLKYLKTLNGE